VIGVVLEDSHDGRLQAGVLARRLEVDELDEPNDQDENRSGCVDKQGSIERANLVEGGRNHRRKCIEG
jgi:hypothetical protein